MEVENGKKSVSLSLVDLDENILVLILNKLPVTAIISCKSVRKSWYLLVSSSYFANLYRENPPFKSLIISYLNNLSLIELKGDCCSSVKPITLAPKSGPHPIVSNGYTKLVGSCNGYLCFALGGVVSVMNPLSGISFMLPQQPSYRYNIPLRDPSDYDYDYDLLKCRNSSYGFGFCPKTQQYKVVEIAKYGRSSDTELNVFTLGIDKSWRRLVHEHSPFPVVANGSTWFVDFSMQFCVVNGNGALHWILNKKGMVNFLYSFDISEEKVRPVPPPVGLKKKRDYTRPVFSAGLFMFVAQE